jgi:hypothetical protein
MFSTNWMGKWFLRTSRTKFPINSSCYTLSFLKRSMALKKIYIALELTIGLFFSKLFLN